MKQTLNAEELLSRRKPRRLPSSGAKIYPRAKCNNEASDSATLIDFVGEDRPGLLYDLTKTFADRTCNIELVLIDTEAHKAIDVFYVTCGGQKLSEPLQQELEQALVAAALAG